MLKYRHQTCCLVHVGRCADKMSSELVFLLLDVITDGLFALRTKDFHVFLLDLDLCKENTYFKSKGNGSVKKYFLWTGSNMQLKFDWHRRRGGKNKKSSLALSCSTCLIYTCFSSIGFLVLFVS